MAFWLSFLYAAGHAAVVIILGLLALAFRIILPDWIDPILERVVGATLLLLGGWIVYSLIAYARGGQDFRFRSRWMLVFAGLRRIGWWLRARFTGLPTEPAHSHLDQYGWRTALTIGAVHGIGAETGTQVLLIAAIGGSDTGAFGIAMLLAFVLGLIVSNSIIALLAVTGFVGSTRFRAIYLVIGAVTAVFSLVVGTYFLLGLSAELPDLFQLTGVLGGPEE
jgi:high-affinity nickel-transport protein